MVPAFKNPAKLPGQSNLCCWTVVLLVILPCSCVGQTSSQLVFTNCSTEKQLPSAHPDKVEFNIELVLDEGVESANCSWIIPNHDTNTDRVGNTVWFLASETPVKLCTDALIWAYDKVDSHKNVSFSDLLCAKNRAQYAFNGRPGFPTAVAFSLHNVTVRRIPLFTYRSISWTGETCPGDYLRISASPQPQRIWVGRKAYSDYLPVGIGCFWEIASEDKGIVTIELTTFLNGGDTCNELLVREEKNSLKPVSYILCNSYKTVEHTSKTGSVFLELLPNSAGARPKFRIAYSSEDVCNNTLSLSAQTTMERFLKGSSDRDIGLTCAWNVTVELFEDYVVMLGQLDNTQFLEDCGDQDYLLVGEEERKISLCDNSSFPLWSKRNYLPVQLHHQYAGSRRDFFLYYKGVRNVSECQGRWGTYRVPANYTYWTLLGSYGIKTLLSSIGDQCGWHFVSSSTGHVMQVRVDIMEEEGSGKHNCSLWKDTFQMMETNQSTLTTSDSGAAILSSCIQNDSSVKLIFTSSSSALTLVYQADRPALHPSFSVWYGMKEDSVMQNNMPKFEDLTGLMVFLIIIGITMIILMVIAAYLLLRKKGVCVSH